MSDRKGSIVASFPVTERQQVMMVTNGGQGIRSPIHDVRIAGRKTLGVTLFRVGPEERVVSVASIADEEGSVENGPESDMDGVIDTVVLDSGIIESGATGDGSGEAGPAGTDEPTA